MTIRILTQEKIERIKSSTNGEGKQIKTNPFFFFYKWREFEYEGALT